MDIFSDVRDWNAKRPSERSTLKGQKVLSDGHVKVSKGDPIVRYHWKGQKVISDGDVKSVKR